ncbi:hypothetical protein MAR_020526 [Mya arenaria]|uniref:Uncharacterized protein n=1 Tax=Mya arenaria TaxID=6604 RepID=A0ABY7E8K4_MYAAR|nr:hypothetical protein MAR_020526 [Mya arenaria]
MSFLAKDGIPKCTPDVDDILHQGTALFNLICLNQSGMTIQEFPTSVFIFNKSYTCSFYGPRSGLISQTSNDAESLTFCVISALNDCFEETSSLILTLGNSPGATIAPKKVNNTFVVLESHSRDDAGMCKPEGRAVVLQFFKINDLFKYVKDLAGSISADANMPFEVTATLIIIERQESVLSRKRARHAFTPDHEMDGLFCLACLVFLDTAHRRPNLLVKDAYRNWKDALCGRQGISMRGHRDDDTTKSLNKGNFKALEDFRADSGESTLKDHLENCAKKRFIYF